jgi:hypothetical protein
MSPFSVVSRKAWKPEWVTYLRSFRPIFLGSVDAAARAQKVVRRPESSRVVDGRPKLHTRGLVERGDAHVPDPAERSGT